MRDLRNNRTARFWVPTLCSKYSQTRYRKLISQHFRAMREFEMLGMSFSYFKWFLLCILFRINASHCRLHYLQLALWKHFVWVTSLSLSLKGKRANNSISSLSMLFILSWYFYTFNKTHFCSICWRYYAKSRSVYQ